MVKKYLVSVLNITALVLRDIRKSTSGLQIEGVSSGIGAKEAKNEKGVIEANFGYDAPCRCRSRDTLVLRGHRRVVQWICGRMLL